MSTVSTDKYLVVFVCCIRGSRMGGDYRSGRSGGMPPMRGRRDDYDDRRRSGGGGYGGGGGG